MTPLHPVVLDRRHLHSAFPLMRMAAPDTTLEGWLDYGRRQVGGGSLPRRGLVALACARGYFYGLAAFQRGGRPPAPVVLEVRLLSQASLAPAETPLATLCEAMARLARLMACDLLRLKAAELPAFAGMEALADCGFEKRGDFLEQRLDHAEAASPKEALP